MLVAAVVGRTVFVHAGLRAGHLEGGNRRGPDGEVQEYGGITRLNEQAREWILKSECRPSRRAARAPSASGAPVRFARGARSGMHHVATVPALRGDDSSNEVAFRHRSLPCQ